MGSMGLIEGLGLRTTVSHQIPCFSFIIIRMNKLQLLFHAAGLPPHSLQGQRKQSRGRVLPWERKVGFPSLSGSQSSVQITHVW